MMNYHPIHTLSINMKDWAIRKVNMNCLVAKKTVQISDQIRSNLCAFTNFGFKQTQLFVFCVDAYFPIINFSVMS